MLVLDVKRAHFHSTAQRELYIDLPKEDAEEGMVGLLLRTIYGTRDAAQNLQNEYAGYITALDFQVGKGSPCNCCCPS